MKLEITLAEVQKIIYDHYHVRLHLKNTGENKIQVTHICAVVLVLKGIKDNTIQLFYEVDGLVDLIAKAAHFFLKKKIKTIPVKWNAETKEITVDLNKIEMLKLVTINDIHVINDTIVLDFNLSAL